MRAVVHDRYGPPEVLRIEDVERPVPNDDEVLVKVHATTVTRSDAAWRAAKPFFSRLFTGVRRPTTIGPETKILVYGASGSIGTAGVQLAKHFGAEVTAVCDTKHVELVRSLGADEVIDYTREDFRKNGVEYDVIFDAVGKQRFPRCKDSLKPDGAYLPTDGWGNFAMGLVTKLVGDKTVRLAIPPRYTKEYVLLVKPLIEAGEYRPVVDRTYPLEDVVEATRYVETGQKTGNVVLTVAGS